MLFLQEVAPCVGEHPLGDQSHDLGAGDADAPGCGRTANLVEGHVKGGRVDIGDVHRHLGDAVFVDKPSDSLCGLEGAGLHDGLTVGVAERLAGKTSSLTLGTALLAHVEGDGVGAARGGGIETKIQAAEKTTVYGIPLLLANGSTPNIIDGLLNGSAKGTLFLAQ